MCRNIKKLRRPDTAPTDEELYEAALQFVRKISGYRKPSQSNARAFDKAVHDVASASRKFFSTLHQHHSRPVPNATPNSTVSP